MLSTGRAPAPADGLLQIGAPDDGGHGRVILDGVGGDPHRGLLQQLGHHRCQHLDVTELLGRRAEEQVPVLARNVGVPCLEAVLHGHGDLAVLPADHLLQLAGVDRVRLLGAGDVLKLLLVDVHERLPRSGQTREGPRGSTPDIIDATRV